VIDCLRIEIDGGAGAIIKIANPSSPSRHNLTFLLGVSWGGESSQPRNPFCELRSAVNDMFQYPPKAFQPFKSMKSSKPWQNSVLL